MDNEISKWSVLNDFSKTIITLSSALLAITVTLFAKFLGDPASAYKYLIYSSWSFLFIAILLSLITAASISSYLSYASTDNTIEKERSKNYAVKSANFSYIFLGVALLCFLIAGLSYSPSTFDSILSAEMAKNHISKLYKIDEDKLTIPKLVFDKTLGKYDIEIEEGGNTTISYEVTIDSSLKKVVSVTKN